MNENNSAGPLSGVLVFFFSFLVVTILWFDKSERHNRQIIIKIGGMVLHDDLHSTYGFII